MSSTACISLLRHIDHPLVTLVLATINNSTCLIASINSSKKACNRGQSMLVATLIPPTHATQSAAVSMAIGCCCSIMAATASAVNRLPVNKVYFYLLSGLIKQEIVFCLGY